MTSPALSPARRRHAQNRVGLDDAGVLVMDLCSSDAAFIVSKDLQ
jgi:hypothetical protein